VLRRPRLSSLRLLLLVVLERVSAPAVGAVDPAVRRMPEVLLAGGRHAGVKAGERRGGAWGEPSRRGDARDARCPGAVGNGRTGCGREGHGDRPRRSRRQSPGRRRQPWDPGRASRHRTMSPGAGTQGASAGTWLRQEGRRRRLGGW